MSYYMASCIPKGLNGQVPCALRFRALMTSSFLLKPKESSLTTVTASNPDILLKSIKCSTETSDVLHYIDKHHSIMNQGHLLHAFKTIFSLQKGDSNGMSNGEVLKSTEFHTLCNELKHRVRSLELNDTIDVLKTLSYLGVPASSKLVSILLNILASNLNELSLHQIIFLDFLVKDFKSTPIVEALRIALPVVFQANLEVKTDKENVAQACYLLHYAVRKKLPMKCIDLLIDIIMHQREKLDLSAAMSVIRSLCDFVNTDESHRPLLHHALDIVLDNMELCTFSELDVLLNKLIQKHSKDNYFFYHEDFVNNVCKYVVENNNGFEETMWILKKLNRLGHIDIKLLDSTAYKAEQEPQVFFKRPLLLGTFVRALVIADYRPPNWASLEPILANHTNEAFKHNAGLPWISYVRDLCILGIWPLSIIEQMFKSEFLNKYLDKYQSVMDLIQVLCLYQEITTLCPDHFSVKPPQDIIEKAIDVNGRHLGTHPLLASLQQGLGGKMYVATGIYTKLGHLLHHVIVMRKGGYPVPVNSVPSDLHQRIYVDNLNVESDQQVISVLYLPNSFYSANTGKVRGSIRFHLDSIRALGIVVVPISSNQWDYLLEHERIPYLMREIKQVCDGLEVFQDKS